MSYRLMQPVLAPLLSHRPTGVIIIGAAALHAGLMMAGLPGWHCPIRYGLGIPCPGCGLSRALAALFRGDWPTSLAYHAFAPLFLLGLGLVAVASFLPSRSRQPLIVWLGRVERLSGVGVIFFIGLMVYWLIRLVFLGPAFINLIMG